jgi:hypothetical protein
MMDLEDLEQHAQTHRAMLRRLEAKMRARRSLNESWCGHVNVTGILCLSPSSTDSTTMRVRPSRDRWVAGCNDCFKDSSEEHPVSDYVYSLPAKEVLDRDGLIGWLNHLTEKPWFEPGFESFLDAVAFARAVHRRGAVAPAREDLRVARWPGIRRSSGAAWEDDD